MITGLLRCESGGDESVFPSTWFSWSYTSRRKLVTQKALNKHTEIPLVIVRHDPGVWPQGASAFSNVERPRVMSQVLGLVHLAARAKAGKPAVDFVPFLQVPKTLFAFSWRVPSQSPENPSLCRVFDVRIGEFPDREVDFIRVCFSVDHHSHIHRHIIK